jgi:hypothetical protein
MHFYFLLASGAILLSNKKKAHFVSLGYPLVIVERAGGQVQTGDQTMTKTDTMNYTSAQQSQLMYLV